MKHPEILRTVEDLSTAPVGTVVQTGAVEVVITVETGGSLVIPQDSAVAERYEAGIWCFTGDENTYDDEQLHLPCKVLRWGEGSEQ